MKEKKITVFQVAGTYIGTIVGAGFASGQETLQFFVSFGLIGAVGIFVITLLFIYFGYVIMDLGWKLNASSHLPIVSKVGGKLFGGFSDIIITFFLFGALTAMIAGSGALFHQEFKLHPMIGCLFMAVITVITVLSGFKNIINSISIIVPFLILAAILVSISTITNNSNPTFYYANDLETTPLLRNWLWSSILYISYNIVPSISILGPLGRSAADRKTIKHGAILGGIGLGVGALAIFAALYVNLDSIKNLEIPMIMIAGRISLPIRNLYAIVLIAEIYTTAVGDLYGFSARICDMKTKKATFIVIGSSILAFVASMAGFSNLVKYLYPVVGYCGIVTLICLLYHRLKS